MGVVKCHIIPSTLLEADILRILGRSTNMHRHWWYLGPEGQIVIPHHGLREFLDRKLPTMFSRYLSDRVGFSRVR